MQDPMLAEQIRTTKDLIDSEVSEIFLTRKAAKTKNRAGGVTRSGAPSVLGLQRFFFAQVTPDMIRIVDEDGVNRVVRWVLVGMPDADMEVGDTFNHHGCDFRIAEMHPDRRWESRAWVAEVR